ncbi:hypothetical protein LOC68_01825 [Blastopirellula sp. JC732]|uniref:Carboxypeptidase regulatory-like domain-containing protein n=1 Tax=Blastopirellula sediminis TaxID=2894196 RepID=A0A9X1SHE5_9BACT|nr:hypothetical protein [Blastopirellula sediminis]MCC9608073.1 hypothetical protein [Blastopirellula sediminis]MCC9627134.1 hypothetical protein [Blastopirellula sediminis]
MANLLCSALRGKWICAAAILVAVGCGRGGIPLLGEVTYNGQPLDSGSIVFIPADGVGPSRGTTITDGKFKINASQQLSPGKVIVQVSGAVKTGRQMEAPPPSPPGQIIDEIRYVEFPEQELEIGADANEPLSVSFDSTKKTSNRARK